MIVNTIALTKGIRTEFNKSLVNAPPQKYSPVTTTVNSNVSTEDYGWMGHVPQLREWIGNKQLKSIEDYEYSIKNKTWEASLEVKAEEIEDDQGPIIQPRIQDLALKAAAFPARLVSDLIDNGETGLAYDGNAFFSNRAAPNDNLLTGTGTTEAQIMADLATARAAMMAFADDNGDPMEIHGDVVVCPPLLEVTFMRLANSMAFVGGSAQTPEKNFWQSALKGVIVDPRLSDANDWFLLASGYPLKPFIYQNRKAAKLVSSTGDVDFLRFMQNKYVYSVEMRGNAGYGYYQMAVKTVNA